MNNGLHNHQTGASIAPHASRWMWRVVPMALLLVLGATTGGGCSCEDEEGSIVTPEAPELLVSPDSITFSAASIGNPETRTINISNNGEGTLSELSFRLEQGGQAFSIAPPAETVIPSGGSLTANVTYEPDDEFADQGTLYITGSNGQSAEVSLSSLAPRRELQCIPSTITINAGEIGETVSMDVEVSNIGSLPATVTDLNIALGTDFVITDNGGLPSPLNPNDSTTVEITFNAATGGISEDTLRIVVEEDAQIFECPIRGLTALPVIEFNPRRIDFGTIPVGDTVTAPVTIQNEGSSELKISGLDFLRGTSEDFGIVTPLTEEIVIVPGETFDIELSYTASSTTANGNAVVISNDPSQPQATIPLLGRPSRPDLVTSPPAINFGNVGQGVEVHRTLTLFNDGAETLDISSMRIDGTPEFSITPLPSFPPSTDQSGLLAPGEEVELEINYEPVDLGSDLATINIRSNDPDNEITQVPLTATGLAEAVCRVRIRPDPVNFGLVTRGSERIINAQVTNVGTGPCAFGNASASGILNDAFSVGDISHNNGEEFGPGESVSVGVVYNPTSFDINNGQLAINVTDALTSNQVYCNAGERCQNNPGDFACTFDPPPCGVDLQGFAGISDIAVIPGSLEFGLVTLGCASQTRTVTVYNTGRADLTISSIELETQGCENFELRALPVTPATIQADTPISFQVIYEPSELGEDFCNVVIDSDASEGESLLRIPMSGEGTNLSSQTDIFEQVSGRKVDVLFAIDGSGSMSEEQDNVARNLGDFLSTAELLDNDFQIAVVHLDLDETKELDGRDYAAGEMMGNPPFLTRAQPNYLAEFQRRVRMGASGGNTEAGLEAARKALSDPYITQTNVSCSNDSACSEPYEVCRNNVCSGANGGFIREDASLEIIMISDEEDQSTATPEFYVDFFRSIKGFRNDALMHVSSIVGADPRSNTPGTCESSNGSADPGRRYATVSSATGGTVGSICNSDFGSYLQNIGNRAFGLRVEFFLSRAAEPATVEVRVNGQVVNTGWTYDSATNSVIFDRTATPQPGDTITVDYEARCF